METVSLANYANETIEKWMANQITTGRSFPDSRDGLKDATRAIYQSMSTLVKGNKSSVRMNALLGYLSDMKEGSEKTNMSILYRMSLSEYPLFDTTNWAIGGKQNTINMITGSESRPRYIDMSLTPLGEYLLTYLQYFKLNHELSISADKPRWEVVRTPLPLSLIIPQINLADGISNTAPGLDLLEVIDAFIEHVEKDKATTTEDIAKHITGISLSPNTTTLMSNQALHDLIELGVSKFTQLVNIEIYKKEILVKDLPFKTFGKTIQNDIAKVFDLGQSGDWTRGLTSAVITQILPENSKDSMITISYKLNKGFTIDDLREELYRKTKLKNIIVYENIVNDFTNKESSKVLTIKSVRETFDYHYDEALELKRLQTQSKIKDLEAKFGNAVFMEKITKPIVAEIVASVITDKKKRKLAKEYLTKAKGIFLQCLTNEKSLDMNSIKHIAHILPAFKGMLSAKAIEYSDMQGIPMEEALDMVLDEEVPSQWTEQEIRLIFTDEYSVLYKLDERDVALQTIENFKKDLEFLKSSLELDVLKKEIIRELELLKMQYGERQKNRKLLALPFQERERMKEYRKLALKEMKRIPTDLPVNVLISEDGYAKLSFYLSDSMPNLKAVVQATMADSLIVVNRTLDSNKIPIESLTLSPKKIADFSDTLFIMPQDYNYMLNDQYILVTNKGRVTRVSHNAFNFKNKEIRVGIAEDEHIIFARRVSQSHVDNGDVLVMKTDDNRLKGICLYELAVKNTLVEFYNMFTNMSIDNIHSVSILDPDTYNIYGWKNGMESSYVHKIRCRNVSKPIVIDFKSLDAVFTFGKTLSWGNSNPICDFADITGEQGFETLLPPFVQEVPSEVDEDITFNSLSELKVIDVQTTMGRLLRPSFEVSELQLEIIGRKYGGGE